MRQIAEPWIDIEVLRAGHSGASNMPKGSRDSTLIQIEQAQAALRDSIDKARELADESERLIRKHREEIAKPPNPAS
jgi:hypothetical protein